MSLSEKERVILEFEKEFLDCIEKKCCLNTQDLIKIVDKVRHKIKDEVV